MTRSASIYFQVRHFDTLKTVPKCPAVSRSYDYTAVLAIGMKIATIIMKQGLRISNKFCVSFVSLTVVKFLEIIHDANQ